MINFSLNYALRNNVIDLQVTGFCYFYGSVLAGPQVRGKITALETLSCV